MPIITTSVFVRTGSVASALIYPIVVPAVAFLLCLFLMRETRTMSIWKPEPPEGAFATPRHA